MKDASTTCRQLRQSQSQTRRGPRKRDLSIPADGERHRVIKRTRPDMAPTKPIVGHEKLGRPGPKRLPVATGSSVNTPQNAPAFSLPTPEPTISRSQVANSGGELAEFLPSATPASDEAKIHDAGHEAYSTSRDHPIELDAGQEDGLFDLTWVSHLQDDEGNSHVLSNVKDAGTDQVPGQYAEVVQKETVFNGAGASEVDQNCPFCADGSEDCIIHNFLL